jgi:hypothetical protein
MGAHKNGTTTRSHHPAAKPGGAFLFTHNFDIDEDWFTHWIPQSVLPY